MKRSVVVISTQIAGKKVFISAETRRANNTVVPEYTSDINDAKDYISEQIAEGRFRVLSNPFDRVFLAETGVIEERKRMFTISEDLN